MRSTPVEEYLEEISTTLSEETYGRLSDAIYETNCEFDEEVASYRAENAKLIVKLNAEHIVRQNAEVENAKLRELCEDMLDCIEIRVAFGRPPTGEMYERFADAARELGIEVDS